MGIHDGISAKGGRMKIYCDGSGWNGKLSKFGIITDDGKHSTMIFPYPLTNNVMEYSSIILACIVAHENDEIFSDSQLAVNQIKGDWKTKDCSLFPLMQAAKSLIQGKHLSLRWIPRGQNKADKIV